MRGPVSFGSPGPFVVPGRCGTLGWDLRTLCSSPTRCPVAHPRGVT